MYDYKAPPLTASQADALLRVWKMAHHDHGGAEVCARLLLGLYNGPRFPFDLTDLRRLDNTMLNAAFTLLALDARCTQEIHCHLRDLLGEEHHFGPEFEHLAYDWGFKGRCPKKWLPKQPRRRPE